MWNLASKKLKNVKKQRDRFLGFAFASADLFFEVTPSDKIAYITGAPTSMTGRDVENLVGSNWLELFAAEEQAKVYVLKKRAIPGMRCGPILVGLNKKINARKGIVTGFYMPNSENFHVTLSLSDHVMEKLAQVLEEDPGPITTGFKAEDENNEPITTGFKAEDEDNETVTTDFEAEMEKLKVVTTDAKPEDENNKAVTTDFEPDEPKTGKFDETKAVEEDAGPITTDMQPEDDEGKAITTGFTAEDEGEDEVIYNASEFVDEAEKAFKHARENGVDTALTVFDFGRTETIKEENWADMFGRISEFLRSKAVDGKAAAQIADGQYSVLHDENDTADILKAGISEIVDEFNPDGHEVEIETNTIATDLDELSDQQASRALYHAMKAFEENGPEFQFTGLGEGFKTMVSSNTQKLQDFKSAIERVDFDIHFQPVVNLTTKEAEHYEVLSRLKTGEIEDWVKFGEDAGVATDFDLAVVERAINYVHFKAVATRLKVSVNLSSRSIEDPDFFEKLLDQLSKRDLKNKIMFEIIESARVSNIKLIDAFISKLQDEGYEVALDDFQLETDSIKNLKNLDVNYIKIDEKYIRRLVDSKKIQKLLKNVVKMCKKFNIKTVAKHVENQEQAEILEKIGVDYVQGHHYGKAQRAPSYISP